MAIHVQRNVVFVTSSIFAATAAGTLVVYSVLSSKTKLLGDTCLPIVGRFPELYKTETKIPTDNVSVVTRIHHNYRRYSVPFQHFSFKLINLHFSTCLATSDPNLYSNKSRPLDNDAPETTTSSGPSHLDHGPSNQVIQIFMTRHAADVFEGDISGVQSIQELRNAIVGRNYRWPNAVIPYIIAAPFSKHSFQIDSAFFN